MNSAGDPPAWSREAEKAVQPFANFLRRRREDELKRMKVWFTVVNSQIDTSCPGYASYVEIEFYLGISCCFEIVSWNSDRDRLGTI